MKSNRAICSADADICLRETDNPYDDDDDNNNNLDDDRYRVYWTGGSSTTKERRRVRFHQPLFILFTILFKLKLDSTPIFIFIRRWGRHCKDSLDWELTKAIWLGFIKKTIVLFDFSGKVTIEKKRFILI